MAKIDEKWILEQERIRQELRDDLREKGFNIDDDDITLAKLLPLVKQLPEKGTAKSIIDGTLDRFVDFENVSIRRNLFRDSTSLEYVELGRALVLGDRAFAGCSKLHTVKLWQYRTSLADWAFETCPALTYFYVPNLTSYAGYTFNATNNIKHFITPSLTRENLDIGNNQLCIADVYSSKVNRAYNDLTLLIVRNTSGVVALPNSSNIHQGDPEGVEIYVPSELLNDYKTATNWSVFADCFKAIEDSEYEDIYWYSEVLEEIEAENMLNMVNLSASLNSINNNNNLENEIQSDNDNNGDLQAPNNDEDPQTQDAEWSSLI